EDFLQLIRTEVRDVSQVPWSVLFSTNPYWPRCSPKQTGQAKSASVTLYLSLFVFANEDKATRTLVAICLRAFCAVLTLFDMSLSTLTVLSTLGTARRNGESASAAVFSAVFTSGV